MWCCNWCSCLWTDDPHERTPLMSGAPRGGSSRRHEATGNDSVVIRQRSARLPEHTVRDGLYPVEMKPVMVASVDKRLQDHAKLFNTHLELWNRLKGKENELQRMFPVENPQQTLRGTFMHIQKSCRHCSSFSVTRPYHYCLEINYEGREIPHQVIPAFISFNLANRTIKEIIDKGPSLAKSIRMVLSNNRELCREVRVASLGPAMKNALDNFSEDMELLEIALARVDEMESRTKKIFEEFLIQSDFHKIST